MKNQRHVKKGVKQYWKALSVIKQLFPVDTGRKLNVHKTFRRRPGHLLNVLCAFNLRPVSTGLLSGSKPVSRVILWDKRMLEKHCIR